MGALPDPAEITAELERILASDSFSGSKRHSAFLRFVVERAIGGRLDEIKEYQIGVEVYSRGESFDPKLDNIVRVEASRLRARLRDYYENGGRLDPVRVEIPKGAYVPVFRLFAASAPATKVRAGKRWALPVASAGIFSVIVLASTQYLHFRSTPRTRRIAVFGLKEVPNGREAAPWLSTALSELVTMDLTEEERLRTIPADTAAGLRRELGLPAVDGFDRDALSRVRRNAGADLVVAGAYALDPDSDSKTIRLNLRVQDSQSGDTIATAYETGSVDDLFGLAARASSDIRRGLGLREGVSSPGAFVSNAGAMRLYSEGLDALRRFDTLEAKESFERSLQSDPSNPLAWSSLAEAWHTLGNDAKAQDAAQRAVALAGHLGRVEQLEIEARAHMDAKQWRDAIRVYAALWRLAPDSLDIGLQLAECQVSAGEANLALATLKKLRELPQPLGDDPRIDYYEARAYGATGDYHQALGPVRTCERKATDRGQRLLYAKARRLEAGLLGTLGMPGGEEALAESKRLCEQLGDRVCVLSALRVEAINELQNHPAQAKILYERGLAIAQGAGAVGEEVQMREGLIIADSRLGDLSSAEQACRNAIDFAHKTGSPDDFLKYELASISANRGRLSEALAIYGHALEQARAARSEPTVSNVLIAMAVVLKAQGRVRQAGERAHEALEIVRRTGSAIGLFDAWVAQGDVLTNRGDLDGAQRAYEQARQHLDGSDREETGELEAALGELSLCRGDGREAEHHFRTALGVFQSMAYENMELTSQAALVRALLAQNKVDEAMKLAGRITPAAKRTQDAQVRIQILLADAQAVAQGRERATARHILTAAMNEARLLGYGELERQARELASKL